MKRPYKPIDLPERRRRAIGARLWRAEYEAFERIAQSFGMSPSALCAQLARAEIAKHAAPPTAPEIEQENEERRIYA